MTTTRELQVRVGKLEGLVRALNKEQQEVRSDADITKGLEVSNKKLAIIGVIDNLKMAIKTLNELNENGGL